MKKLWIVLAISLSVFIFADCEGIVDRVTDERSALADDILSNIELTDRVVASVDYGNSAIGLDEDISKMKKDLEVMRLDSDSENLNNVNDLIEKIDSLDNEFEELILKPYEFNYLKEKNFLATQRIKKIHNFKDFKIQHLDNTQDIQTLIDLSKKAGYHNDDIRGTLLVGNTVNANIYNEEFVVDYGYKYEYLKKFGIVRFFTTNEDSKLLKNLEELYGVDFIKEGRDIVRMSMASGFTTVQKTSEGVAIEIAFDLEKTKETYVNVYLVDRIFNEVFNTDIFAECYEDDLLKNFTSFNFIYFGEDKVNTFINYEKGVSISYNFDYNDSNVNLDVLNSYIKNMYFSNNKLKKDELHYFVFDEKSNYLLHERSFEPYDVSIIVYKLK